MLNKPFYYFYLAAWKVIRAWLPPEADQFVKFVDAKTILDFIPPNQLSPAMGGTVSKPNRFYSSMYHK